MAVPSLLLFYYDAGAWEHFVVTGPGRVCGVVFGSFASLVVLFSLFIKIMC